MEQGSPPIYEAHQFSRDQLGTMIRISGTYKNRIFPELHLTI
uniref:Uncharacterized protein n=1 Tax=Arundo donax TaxID=35708 RepID=A0A0A9FJ57_ARUDO